jgi:hypothetical protein
LQCFTKVKFKEFHLKETYVYTLKGKILDKYSILQEDDNFVWFSIKLLGGRLEFDQVLLPFLTIFTHWLSVIKVDKVDVIGYDPVEGDMESKILEATDMRTNCRVTLHEVTRKCKSNWNWLYDH